jgi:hypothetical protein
VVAAASICPMAAEMSNGLHAMSPASATWCTPNGATPAEAPTGATPADEPNGATPGEGLNGRSSREDWRMWDGPNRAPGR